MLVWRYDRFARSTQALVNALKEFQRLGVDFFSYQENIDTTTPTGELIFHVMASPAQFESALISQRVRAGMARAKAQAKQEAIAQLLRKGLSMNQVSNQLGVAYGTVYNYARKLKSAMRVNPPFWILLANSFWSEMTIFRHILNSLSDEPTTTPQHACSATNAPGSAGCLVRLGLYITHLMYDRD